MISYAKSKGASVELAGATFAANMKLKELNRKNELDALKHLTELVAIYLPNCYDLKINVGDMKVSEPTYSARLQKLGATYDVPLKVTFVPNANAQVLTDFFWKTLNSISLSREEAKEYKKLNMSVFSKEFKYKDNYSTFYSRNNEKIMDIIIVVLTKAAVCELFNFEITDNLAQKVSFSPYFDPRGECRLNFNVTPIGNAVIDPWGDNDGINWRSHEAFSHYYYDLWVSRYGNDIDFNKEMTVDVTLKIRQTDISKYSKFDIQRKSGNLVDLILKSPTKKVEYME